MFPLLALLVAASWSIPAEGRLQPAPPSPARRLLIASPPPAPSSSTSSTDSSAFALNATTSTSDLQHVMTSARPYVVRTMVGPPNSASSSSSSDAASPMASSSSALIAMLDRYGVMGSGGLHAAGMAGSGIRPTALAVEYAAAAAVAAAPAPLPAPAPERSGARGAAGTALLALATGGFALLF